jgi:hypothetical protein
MNASFYKFVYPESRLFSTRNLGHAATLFWVPTQSRTVQPTRHGRNVNGVGSISEQTAVTSAQASCIKRQGSGCSVFRVAGHTIAFSAMFYDFEQPCLCVTHTEQCVLRADSVLVVSVCSGLLSAVRTLL